MRRYAWICALMLAMHAPSRAYGYPVEVITAPTVEMALTANIEATAAGFGEQLASLAELISTTVNVVKGVNRVAAFCRQAVEAVEFLRKLDRETVLEHAKRGLYKSMPELRELEREVRLTMEEKRALEEDRFLNNRTYHDTEMAALLGAAANAGYAASVYPILFPESQKYREMVSEAEKLLAYRFRRVGLGRDRAVKTAATKVHAEKVKHASDEAEQKGRVDLELEALQAQSGMQTMVNTQAMADAKMAEIAEQEAAALRRKAAEKATRDALKATAATLGEIGVVR